MYQSRKKHVHITSNVYLYFTATYFYFFVAPDCGVTLYQCANMED